LLELTSHCSSKLTLTQDMVHMTRNRIQSFSTSATNFLETKGINLTGLLGGA